MLDRQEIIKVFFALLLMFLGATLHDADGLTAPKTPPEEKDKAFWNRLSLDDIQARLRQRPNNKLAKNIILFLGDGMGGSTVTAARILKGQLNDRPGEETVLNFEKFPYLAQAKVYNLDRQVPDSSSSATAILSGVKTKQFLVGLDGNANFEDCINSRGKELDTILDWAQAVQMKTGIVTTSRVTHATPSSAYAHAAHRWWEGDVDVKDVAGDCKDITRQLVEDNRDINVIFGGGRRYFLPNDVTDPETGRIDRNQRLDGRNMIENWIKDKEDRGLSHKYAWNKDGFDSIDPDFTDYAMGLFSHSHMSYEGDRDKSGPTGEPSLAEMVKKAIRMLKKDDSGYFLFVESARIDHAHHNNQPIRALHEVLAFEDAIQEAIDLTDADDTLLIVTADHSLVFNIAGTAYRGTDILGILEPNTIEISDGKSQTVLQYSNGPGYSEPRANLSQNISDDSRNVYPSGIPIGQATHSGEDVNIYARGPMAHVFTGVHEQTYIAHVMAYSACIGPYRGNCIRHDEEPCTSSANPNSVELTMAIWILICMTSVLRLYT